MIVFSVRSQRLFYIVKMFVCSMKIIGLAPFGVKKSSAQIGTFNPRVEAFEYSKFGLAYNILLSIMAVLFGAINQLRPFSDKPADDSVSHIVSDSIGRANILLVNLTVCLILIAWGTRQERAASVMNRLLEIDLDLTSFEKPPFNERTLICAIIHVLLTTLTWSWTWYFMWVMINYDEGQSYILRVIPYIWKRSIIFWFITEYYMVVGLVANDVEAVNKYLLDFKETGTHLSSPSFRHGLQATECSSGSQDLTRRKLIHYHTIRTRLYNLCGEIGDFFSLPILFCIASCSVSLCENLFRLIRHLQKDVMIQRSLGPLFSRVATSILTCAYPIISLALNVTRIKKEAQLTKQIVDTLSEVAIRGEIISELELFSRQLLHENISFTAYGFFSLDSSFLLSMLGGVTTYFIALMQLPDKDCTEVH